MKARKAGLVLLETNRTRGSWCHTANISVITFRSEYLWVIHHRLRALNITVNTQRSAALSVPLCLLFSDVLLFFQMCFAFFPLFCPHLCFCVSSLQESRDGAEEEAGRGGKEEEGGGGEADSGGCVAAGGPQTAELCWPLLFLTLEAVCRWFTGRILQVNSPASIKGAVWV